MYLSVMYHMGRVRHVTAEPFFIIMGGRVKKVFSRADPFSRREGGQKVFSRTDPLRGGGK